MPTFLDFVYAEGLTLQYFFIDSGRLTFLLHPSLLLFQISMSVQRAKTTATSFVVTPMARLSAHAILDSHWVVMERPAMVLLLH